MQKSQNSRSIGNIGETAVCGFLERHGYTVLKRNFTVRGGEIDIVAQKNDVIAFVEVKTRKVGALSCGEQAITEYKRRHIVRTAEIFCYKYRIDCQCRFDVAAVELDGNRVAHLKYYVAAFDASRK